MVQSISITELKTPSPTISRTRTSLELWKVRQEEFQKYQEKKRNTILHDGMKAYDSEDSDSETYSLTDEESDNSVVIDDEDSTESLSSFEAGSASSGEGPEDKNNDKKSSKKNKNKLEVLSAFGSRRKKLRRKSISKAIPVNVTNNNTSVDKTKLAIKTRSILRVVSAIDDETMFPQFLESKFHSHVSCQLIGSKTVMSSYSNTGTMLFLNISNAFQNNLQATLPSSNLIHDSQHYKPYKLENHSNVLTMRVQFPWVASVHENGIVQLYNMISETCKKGKLPESKGGATMKQHYCIFITHESLYLISGSAIYEYNPYEISATPREYAFEDENGNPFFVQEMQQSLSYMISESVFFICGPFNYYIWDVSNYESSKAKLLAKSGIGPTRTTSFLMSACNFNTAVVVSRDSYAIWRVLPGNAKELANVKVENDIIVTSVYVDEFKIFVGHSNGLISVRNTSTGEYMYDLNTIDGITQPDSSDNHAKLTGLVLNEKVNCIDKVGPWLICGFQNARICIYEASKPRSFPIAECKPGKSGVIKSLLVEDGVVYFILMKIKKLEDEEKKKTVLGSWVPPFVRADLKNFFRLSEFDAKLKVGRPSDKPFGSPVKQMIVKDGINYCLHDNNQVSLWNVEASTFMKAVELPDQFKNAPILKVSLVANILIMMQSKAIHTFDIRDFIFTNHYEIRDNFTCLTLGGRTLYAGVDDGNVLAYEILSQSNIIKHSYFCHAMKINQVMFRDGILYTASDDCSIKSFFAQTSLQGKQGDIRHMFGGHTGAVIDFRLIKTNACVLLYSMSKDNSLRIWDTVLGVCTKVVPLDSSYELNMDNLIEQHRSLFLIKKLDPSTPDLFNFALYDLKKVKYYSNYAHRSPVRLLTKATHNGQAILLAVTNDNTIYRWNPWSGECLEKYHTYQNTITSLTADSDTCYVGDVDGQIVQINFSSVSINEQTPTKLVVNEGEYNSEALGRMGYLKHKGSSSNMKKELKNMFSKSKEALLTQSDPLPKTWSSYESAKKPTIMVTEESCDGRASPDMDKLLSNFDNSNLWEVETLSHLQQKKEARSRSGTTASPSRNRSHSANMVHNNQIFNIARKLQDAKLDEIVDLSPTFFEEESKRDPQLRVTRNPVWGRNISFVKLEPEAVKKRSHSTGVSDMIGTIKRLTHRKQKSSSLNDAPPKDHIYKGTF